MSPEISDPEPKIAPDHYPNARDSDRGAVRAFDGRADLDFCWAHWRFSGVPLRN